MRPIRNEKFDFDQRPDVDGGERVLLEIAEDARKLENRYPKETVVPEGGE
jgi:hypothetical protein